jgi:hypothetical protein
LDKQIIDNAKLSLLLFFLGKNLGGVCVYYRQSQSLSLSLSGARALVPFAKDPIFWLKFEASSTARILQQGHKIGNL